MAIWAGAFTNSALNGWSLNQVSSKAIDVSNLFDLVALTLKSVALVDPRVKK